VLTYEKFIYLYSKNLSSEVSPETLIIN